MKVPEGPYQWFEDAEYRLIDGGKEEIRWEPVTPDILNVAWQEGYRAGVAANDELRSEQKCRCGKTPMMGWRGYAGGGTKTYECPECLAASPESAR